MVDRGHDRAPAHGARLAPVGFARGAGDRARSPPPPAGDESPARGPEGAVVAGDGRGPGREIQLPGLLVESTAPPCVHLSVGGRHAPLFGPAPLPGSAGSWPGCSTTWTCSRRQLGCRCMVPARTPQRHGSRIQCPVKRATTGLLSPIRAVKAIDLVLRYWDTLAPSSDTGTALGEGTSAREGEGPTLSSSRGKRGVAQGNAGATLTRSG